MGFLVMELCDRSVVDVFGEAASPEVSLIVGVPGFDRCEKSKSGRASGSDASLSWRYAVAELGRPKLKPLVSLTAREAFLDPLVVLATSKVAADGS